MLNDQQRQAFQEIKDFLDSDHRYHVLCGPGGTGKTHLIEEVCQYCPSAVVTATTNKAVNVLQTRIPAAKTIHSYLSLMVQESRKDGNTYLRSSNPIDANRKLVIVDECSMIDRALFKKINEMPNHVKVLFVGDSFQLPPIKEKISNIYKLNSGYSTLTAPMRNKGQQALIDVCHLARTAVHDNDWRSIVDAVTTKSLVTEGVVDVLNKQDFQDVLHYGMKADDPFQKVLCYTNLRAIQYGNYISRARNQSCLFEVGRTVVNNSSTQGWVSDPEMRKETRVLRTDQELRITNVLETWETDEFNLEHPVPMMRIRVKEVEHLHAHTLNIFKNPLDRMRIVKGFTDQKRWDDMFNFKNHYPDLRMPSSQTVHKSQGSTYSTVYVDFPDLNKCFNAADKLKLFYVAVTRPTNRLVIRMD